jgi:hemerythrin-like metal-binding protein
VGEAIEPILEGLKAYGHTHFQHAEARMAKHRFPGLAAHKVLHEAFLKEVAQISARTGAGKLAVSLATMKMVRGWLNEDIDKAHSAYAAFFHQNIA